LFACGALLDENAGVVTGTVDCSTSTGGTIVGGTLVNNVLSADITFTNPAVTVHVGGSYALDGSGDGLWACTVGCVTSGAWSSEIIAPTAPQCTVISNATGGALLLESGDVLVVHPGSLPSPSENICGELINLPQVVGPGSNIITRAYRFTPAGLQFSTPAVLNTAYDQDEIVGAMTEANLGIYVYDSLTARWVLRGGTVDTVNNLIAVSLDHFSEYAVFDCGIGADTDGALGNGGDILGDDTSVPNGDGTPDLCDLDDDDDLIPDTEDTNPLPGTGICAAFGGSSDGHANPARGDIAYSDGSPPSFDTDGDGVLDGVECLAGTDPRSGSAADRNTCFTAIGTGDLDGDGLEEAWEACGWGYPNMYDNPDGDDDGLGDCQEVMDVNDSGTVNNTDAVFVKQHFFGVIVGDRAAMDINRGGTVNNNDAVLILQAFFGVNPCL
jgi:hypothetical protein